VQIIDCGFSGSNQPPDQKSWRDLGLDKQWIKLAQLLSNAEIARPIQQAAIANGCIGENRKNLIVSAPTNGGKSLVGDLILMQSIIDGGRAVLVEPLRAIAQEKFDRYKVLRKRIERIIDRPFDVAISTGDYRLEGEQYTSPPTGTAQLIITTPERLDAIARNQDYLPWIDSIKSVCVDEAHLIGDKRRGPVIEYLLSFLKLRPAAPRLVLLSASVSDSAKAANQAREQRQRYVFP
jgi:replicative superfamily II helicase